MVVNAFLRVTQYFPLILYGIGGVFAGPLIWLISIIARVMAIVILKQKWNYGKMINFTEGFFNDDFVHNTPKSTVVTSLTLDGDISVEEVRKLFTKNVLEQKIWETGKGEQVRYPEFKQYITTFMGFRVWKVDPHFHIDNHIFERRVTNNNSIEMTTFTAEIDMTSLHQELCNKKFQPRRSPWDITVIRNAVITNESSYSGSLKTILYFRIHHILCDGKSIHKVLVEGLGGKKLNTATEQKTRTTLFQRVLNRATFPIQYILFLLDYSLFAIKYHLHPWKLDMYGSPQYVISFTRSLDLSTIKAAAKKHGVAFSSVIMFMISEAIRSHDKNLAKGDFPTWYILPKENHPPRLTNHMTPVYGSLPTNETSFRVQLQRCNELFVKWKTSNMATMCNAFSYQFGTLLHVFTKIFSLNATCALGITNVAGDKDGFSVGGLPCSEFIQSMGLLPGCEAVLVIILSYKDCVRFTVCGNSVIITEDKAKRLAMDLELSYKKLIEM